jgi:aminoglycoside phosphotransferase (APT) family kinase protein
MALLPPALHPAADHLVPPRFPVPPARADPSCPPAVAAKLLASLRIRDLCYREAPRPVLGGWEAYTYQLQFEPSPNLPHFLAGPLILRIYASPEGVWRARHEFAVQNHLWGLGFPVARPRYLETSCDVFGGPFLLSERLPGETLFHGLLARPWHIWGAPGDMARLHARLHALPTDRFPAPGGPFLLRHLDEIQMQIRNQDLRGLLPGLDWLSLHRPTVVARSPDRATCPASILHLDWQPLNLIQADDGNLSVVDWADADVGDPHADLATTLLILECIPRGAQGLWEQVAVPAGRYLTRWGYYLAYGKQRPIDGQRLSYFRAWAALRRLARYGCWLRAGPACTGSKPSCLQYLRPDHLQTLYRYFHRFTGVEISL